MQDSHFSESACQQACGTKYFLAFDLGATSGRAILGTIKTAEGGPSLEMNEIHRFKHAYTQMNGHFYWDICHLWEEILQGMRKAASLKLPISSIGIDTWGVDFVLFGKDKQILRNPYSYRDPFTVGAMEHYFQSVPKQRVYDISGIQFMNFNSLFQLAAMRKQGDAALNVADKILFLPDALSFLLTGEMVTEYTILSTSSFMDAHTGQISNELLAPLGLSDRHFAPCVWPGHQVGYLTPKVQEMTGLGKLPVVAVAGHDTGSAVAAVPATEAGFAYLSSGTWSLMGIESKQPIITPESFELNFTNEGGIEGTTRVLKNICGMWIFEQCRKEWMDAPQAYDDIYEATEKMQPFVSFINPDDACFANPKSMVTAIKDYCARTRQHVPQTWQEQSRCIFDSLAMRYKQVFAMLQKLSATPLTKLHIIGGGAQNKMLNQFTANAVGVETLAGPGEATAIGNIMIQAKAAGIVKDLEEMRRVIAQCVAPQSYLPQDSVHWENAYNQYLSATK